MKKLITLLLVLTGMVCTAMAGTSTTVYYAVPSATVGTYTVKLNVQLQTGVDNWKATDMSKTKYTYNGMPIYTCSYTDEYNGVATMQFQLYSDKWESQVQPISSWTGVTTYNGKMYVHDSGWVDHNTDGLKGSWDSWTNKIEFEDGAATVDLTALSDAEFKIEVGGTLYGAQNSGAKMFWDDCTNWTLDGSNNCILQVSATGTYTFSLAEGKKVSVTFPSYTTNEVYFYNNHSWEYTPVVYLLGESYWDGDKGSGSKSKDKGHAMTQVGVSNLWKLEYPSSLGNSNGYIAIVKNRQDNEEHFYDTQAVYRTDFNTSTPVYYPNTTNPINKNYYDYDSKWTAYWNNGIWYSYTAPSTPYSRTGLTVGNFGTICLPYAATVEGATVYQITSKVVDGGNVTAINLSEVNELEAGVAYIFKATSTTLTATLTGNFTGPVTNAMLGNYETSASVPEGNYIVYQNKIRKAGTGVTVGQYKGYIIPENILPASSRSANFLSFDDETTGINAIENAEPATEKAEYFNLNGQRVMNPTKGLYIVNGKKVVIK